MKWFKHMSDSFQDPVLINAWDKFGDKAIIIYWYLHELYAQKYDKIDSEDGFLVITSWEDFEQRVRTNRKTIQKILNYLKSCNKIFWTPDKNFVVIQIPCFASISDNYSRVKQCRNKSKNGSKNTQNFENDNKMITRLSEDDNKMITTKSENPKSEIPINSGIQPTLVSGVEKNNGNGKDKKMQNDNKMITTHDQNDNKMITRDFENDNKMITTLLDEESLKSPKNEDLDQKSPEDEIVKIEKNFSSDYDLLKSGEILKEKEGVDKRKNKETDKESSKEITKKQDKRIIPEEKEILYKALKTVCTEPKKEIGSVPPANKKVNIEFDFDKISFVNITDKDKQKWKEAFPACDIDIELKRMESWLYANPTKKKKNYRRFIHNWLTKTQEKGGTKGIKKTSIEVAKQRRIW